MVGALLQVLSLSGEDMHIQCGQNARRACRQMVWTWKHLFLTELHTPLSSFLLCKFKSPFKFICHHVRHFLLVGIHQMGLPLGSVLHVIAVDAYELRVQGRQLGFLTPKVILKFIS